MMTEQHLEAGMQSHPHHPHPHPNGRDSDRRRSLCWLSLDGNQYRQGKKSLSQCEEKEG